MANPSEHTITADLPRHVGEGDGADTMHFKADVTFVYTPAKCFSWDPSTVVIPLELELIKVVPLDDKIYLHFSDGEIKVIAENWLADEGYDLACQKAERDRHGDHE